MANNIIDRSALSGLIPEPVTREIMQGAIAESAVLRMARCHKACAGFYGEI